MRPELDIALEDTTKEPVNVRDAVVHKKEQNMACRSAGNATLREKVLHSRHPLAKKLNMKLGEMPHNQRFAKQQCDVRAEFRGEVVDVKGANKAANGEKVANSAKMVAAHKAVAHGLPTKIIANPVNRTDESYDNYEQIEKRDLRRRVTEKRKQEMLTSNETSSAVPHILSRPASVNCVAAEREKTLKHYKEGNEEAYKMVEKINKGVLGYTDTAENGAKKQAAEYNARQKAIAATHQQRNAGQKFANEAAAGLDQMDQ